MLTRGQKKILKVPIEASQKTVKIKAKRAQKSPEKLVNHSDDISKEEELREQLNKVYKSITAEPSYSAKIAKFLRENDIHGQYRRISKKKFPRRRVIARFPFEIFMADLIEYLSYISQLYVLNMKGTSLRRLGVLPFP